MCAVPIWLFSVVPQLRDFLVFIIIIIIIIINADYFPIHQLLGFCNPYTVCLLELYHVDKPVLDAFAKLRKATISFVISVRPSVRPLEPLGSTGRIIMKFDI